jgi:peptidoglycan/LPS O-acetylase OafA/YrhL
MAGALLSLVLRGQRTVQSLVPAAWKTLLACGAALAAIWLFKGLDSDHWTMTSVGFTLIAAFFTAATILVLAAPQASRRTRLFTGKTLTFLGKYSYGLYIFHSALEPTFRRYLSINMLIERVFHHYWPARLAYMTMAMGISILVAWASWHLYEKQFLKLKRFFESRPALPVAQAAPVRVLKAA